jgi:hypothetical protein
MEAAGVFGDNHLVCAERTVTARRHLHLGARQNPLMIRWPLDVCSYGSEVSVRAIIPDGDEEDPGVAFEIVLLGEAL